MTDLRPKARVFSGIQPTGELHLGNYFGAVQNWVLLQDTFDCIYCVVDYHAITMQIEPEKLPRRTLGVAAELIACGIDPGRSILFVQSHVAEHTELAWVLSCAAAYGDLTRMTQFKDKSDQAEFVSAGLFTYPVLQAADILLYRASRVPVGHDQIQHVELTREIGRKFNAIVGRDYLPDVQALLTEGKRIMSPADPTRKMSKSLGEKHYIGILEDPDSVRSKIRSAVTDTGGTAGQGMSPGVESLFGLLRLCAPAEVTDGLLAEHGKGTLKYVQLKDAVATYLLKVQAPIRERRAALTDVIVAEALARGAERAGAIARETMEEVRRLVGVGPGRL